MRQVFIESKSDIILLKITLQAKHLTFSPRPSCCFHFFDVTTDASLCIFLSSSFKAEKQWFLFPLLCLRLRHLVKYLVLYLHKLIQPGWVNHRPESQNNNSILTGTCRNCGSLCSSLLLTGSWRHTHAAVTSVFEQIYTARYIFCSGLLH